MPTQLIPNPAGKYITLQFLDGNNNIVETPAGASVEFHSNSQKITVAANPSKPLQGDLSFAPVIISSEGAVFALITAEVSGVNDVDGAAYQESKIQVVYSPPKASEITYHASY